MPPKKAGKKDGAAKLSDKENCARAEAELLSLQRLLELRSHEAVEARRSERLWRERMDAFQASLVQQKEDTLDITADMVRQYKAMQEQLMRRIADLEAENEAQRKVVQERDAEVERLKADLATMRKTCDSEVLEYQRRMDDMQMEFTTMLRSTLDQMHERLAARP